MNGKTVMACIDAAHATLVAHTDEIARSTSRSATAITSSTCCAAWRRCCDCARRSKPPRSGPRSTSARRKYSRRWADRRGRCSFRCSTAWRRRRRTTRWTSRAFARIFAAGVDAVGQRGKTGIGSKTMMDVLIPVASTLRGHWRARARRPRKCSTRCRDVAEESHARHARHARDQGPRIVSRRALRAATSIPARARAS